MFERFTDRARRVVVLAQQEARHLNHNYLGTEHILLGLVHEGEGVAAKALESLEISAEVVRQQVEEIIGRGTKASEPRIPFTPQAKKVLELSLREAKGLGHDYIGTEHILLGVIREAEGVAAQVLQKLGAHLDAVRKAVLDILAAHSGGEEPWPEAERTEPVEHDEPHCPQCRAHLRESAAYRVIDVPAYQGEGTRAITFAFCTRCGTWLGTVA
jgi:ATP-dependent Clp protease ATP-binding subunit ClpC